MRQGLYGLMSWIIKDMQMIPEDILEAYHAQQIRLPKHATLWLEGDKAMHYYQLKSGELKVSNFNDEGKEFVQGMFQEGQSLGEPPLFGDFAYPGTATASSDSVLWRLPLAEVKRLLQDHPEIHMKLTQKLSTRLQYKAMMMKEISSYEPEHRVLSIIDYFGKKENTASYEVPFTRQELANMTGLRVETVIRTIKALEQKEALEIINRKVFRYYQK